MFRPKLSINKNLTDSDNFKEILLHVNFLMMKNLSHEGLYLENEKLRVSSYEFTYTSFEFQSTSYEFKSTS